MRIHTDTLNLDTITRCVPEPNVHHTITPHGSRSRARAFEVKLWADPGQDRHGITRRYSTSGPYGTTDGVFRACTWVEWGDFLCDLYLNDENIKTRAYDDPEQFIVITHAEALHRDRFGSYNDHITHAVRWESLLRVTLPSFATWRNTHPTAARERERQNQ